MIAVWVIWIESIIIFQFDLISYFLIVISISYTVFFFTWNNQQEINTHLKWKKYVLSIANLNDTERT